MFERRPPVPSTHGNVGGDLEIFLQWFQSRWYNPQKVVYMDPHLKDMYIGVRAIYSETTVFHTTHYMEFQGLLLENLRAGQAQVLTWT